MILTGDCLAILPTLEAGSIDAICTDPPYGIGFMGHEWDQPGEHGATRRDGQANRKRGHIRRDGRHVDGGAMAVGLYDLSLTSNRRFQGWCEAWARELLRVAKPGAHLLVFGGTRTYHRLTAGLEDAGWEIRDCLVWAYASGFPKSLDVSKAIDRAVGATREVISEGAAVKRTIPGADQNATGSWIKDDGHVFVPTETRAATPDAARWSGWGTALKPAWEPIVLARKPLVGTVAGNVLAHGTGALNIDATRIAAEPYSYPNGPQGNVDPTSISLPRSEQPYHSDGGRWPANVVLTDPIFDGGTPGVVGGGEQSGGGTPPRRNVGDDGRVAYGESWNGDATGKVPVDIAGTYSRFFLIPKADRSDREPVLGALAGLSVDDREHAFDSSNENVGNTVAARRRNSHPTVKPVELMRHLVRLVTPRGGTVLDPFLGSGTTAVAAELEGFRWLGIERQADYVAIAEARLNGTQRGLGLEVTAPTSRRARSRSHWPAQRGPHNADVLFGGGFSSGQDGLLERTEEGA